MSEAVLEKSQSVPRRAIGGRTNTYLDLALPPTLMIDKTHAQA